MAFCVYIIAMENNFIVIKNKYLEVTLSSLGASIYRIVFNNEDMILTTKNKDDFNKGYIYFGKTIGRVCGRIESKPHGVYHPQENENGISLHGGEDGLSRKIFNYESHPTFVEFYYLSKDQEAGYPGNLILRVRYELIDNSLIISYHAVIDKPCLLALTNHAYFCLGEDDLRKLFIQMNNDKYLITDERLLPIKSDDVPDKWNFVNGKQLSECGNIDNYFSLKNGGISLLSNKYLLKIETNYSGAVLFTDHFKDNVEVLSSKEKMYRGIAIEPQDNQLERKELLPNEIYERYIKYTFKKL